MPAYNFLLRFAPKVENGEKLHTIRARRKRPTLPGETLYLYTGLRSKNARKLRPDNPKCTAVFPIEIHAYGRSARVKIGLEWIPPHELDAFAKSDGFDGWADFCKFWRDVHGLTPDNPLKGFELIQWEPKPK